jgi:hypothetical protein
LAPARCLFRDNFAFLRKVLIVSFPRVHSNYGVMLGTLDLVPKPIGKLPVLVTGSSRQSLGWIAEEADGWITYPRPLERQAELADRGRAMVAEAAPGTFKPFVQSLYIDLSDDPDMPPQPIHLGYRAGRNFVLRFLDGLRAHSHANMLCSRTREAACLARGLQRSRHCGKARWRKREALALPPASLFGQMDQAS